VCATVLESEKFLRPVEQSWSHRLLKLGLSLGFLALFAGILVASNTPATEYEISIYTATPLPFWAGLTVALLVAIVGSVYSYRTRLGSVSLLLGGTGVAAVVGLPLIRGYRFYGLSDSLTHLGWARAMSLGQIPLNDIVYPSGHVMAGGLAAAANLSVSQAMMLVVFLYFVAYIVFLPLCVRVLVSDRRVTAIAAFSGFLLLPITNISTHNMFHPFTLATLFVPAVLFVMFKHVMRETSGRLVPQRVSPTGLMLPVVSVGLLFVHPLATLNLLILFGTFVFLQWVYRRKHPRHPISEFRGIYGQILVLGVAFVWWNLGHGPMFQMAEGVATALENRFIHGTAQTGEVVSQRQEAAREVEVNLFMLVLKLFGVVAIYALAASGLSLRVIYNRIRNQSIPTSRESLVVYFVCAGVVLTPYALAQFIGKVSSFFFRHVGFGMVIVTILGALALDRGASRAPFSSDVLRPLVVGGVVVVLALSLLVAFPSPFIHKTNHHVTDQQLSGYDTFYDQKSTVPADEEGAVWLTGIRIADGRFRDALLRGGSDDFLPYSGPVTEREIMSGLPAHYATSENPVERRDHYLPVTDSTWAREVVVTQEAYYSAESFAALRSQYGVHKVQSNGGFTNYYIDVSLAEAPPNATTGNESADTPSPDGTADTPPPGNATTGTPTPDGNAIDTPPRDTEAVATPPPDDGDTTTPLSGDATTDTASIENETTGTPSGDGTPGTSPPDNETAGTPSENDTADLPKSRRADTGLLGGKVRSGAVGGWVLTGLFAGAIARRRGRST